MQEVRSKRALDRLAGIVTPTAAVIRDGSPRTVPVSSVVEGDLIRVLPGDQVVADGRLVAGEGLSLDWWPPTRCCSGASSDTCPDQAGR